MSRETPEDSDKPPTGPTGGFGQIGSHHAPADLDYEVLRRIGQGGYGEVWLVRDHSGRYFACKVIYRESFNEDRPYEREFAGIQAFEPVSRANAGQINVLHVGRRDEAGYFYYIMELADDTTTGRDIVPDRYVPRTLKSELQNRGALPVRECIQIGLSLSAALDTLHQNGLIHRDVKPANVVFVNGTPKLADIGLVTDLDVSISYVGTEGYIPPEGPTSAQADIYGLGKVLYEIGTGRDRLDFPELPANFTESEDRDALLELNAVVVKACASDPRERYQSAQELHGDLGLLNSGTSVRQRRRAHRRWAMVKQVALVLCAGVLVAGTVIVFRNRITFVSSSKAIAAKVPVPDAGQLEKAEAEIKEASQAQITPGNRESALRVARDLVDRSDAAVDPAHALASLRLAAAISATVDDFSFANKICARMDERFQINLLQAKLDMLTQGAARTLSRASSGSLAEACILAGFDALEADDYERGTAFADMSRASLRNFNKWRLVKQSAFLSSEMAKCKLAYEQVKPFVKTLQANPDDPAANLAVGKFVCFVKNDWDTGLPMLTRSKNPSLKNVIDREMRQTPDSAGEQKAVGDLWWELSSQAPDTDKGNFQRRAKHWYLKALASSIEPDKSSLKKELDDRLKEVAPASAAVYIISRVDSVEHIDIYSDRIVWSSTRGSVGDRINHVALDDLRRGGSTVLKNCGTTRILPEEVDFLSARLVVDRKPRRKATATLEAVAEDHVRVWLADPPAGSSEIEVTVIFGDPAWKAPASDLPDFGTNTTKK